MDEILLQIPAVITKISTMSHNALRLQVDTQEDLTPLAQASVFAYYNKLGVFAFSKSKIKKEELVVPEYAPNEDEKKTPSQRLRAVFYLLWVQGGKKDTFNNECDSETYYRQMYEKIIDFYKEKLD